MKNRTFFVTSILLFLAMIIYAADTKVSELSMISVPDSNDLVYMVDDPCGTPASKAIPWGDFFAGYAGGSDIVTVGTIAAGVWNGTAIDISDYTNLAVGSHLSLTDDTLDALTANVANGDDVNIPTCDNVYDWVISLNYLTTVDVSDDTNLTAGTHVSLVDDTFDALVDTVADGDDVNLPTCDNVYDFVIGLSYLSTVDISDNTNLTAGDHISLTDDDLDVDDDFLQNTGDSGTGAYDFGGADSFEIPNSNNPTTDAAGEIAWDANDFGLEVYDGSASRLIPSTRFFSATIIQPADVQPNIDAVPLLPVESYWAPFGIKLLHLGIKTNSSSTYSIDFEEWTAPNDGSPSAIETVATSSSYEAIDDGTLTDSDIAAGSIIYADLPATDVNSVQIWGTYYIKDGD